jgi:hypothetical protein
MSTPEFVRGPGIYQFSWKEENIFIRLDRILEDSRYNMYAEITVKELSGQHLHQARVNLMSTSARKTLVGTLTTRAQGLDWFDFLELAFFKTIEAHREGEPAVYLHEIETKERVKYRLEPLIVDGYPTLVYGAGGSGKSLFALYCGNLIALPKSENGLTPEPGNVLYLDYEFSGSETKERSMAMLDGMASPILYRFCYQPLQNDIETIRRLVLDNDINFIVIDSAGPACGGEPEESKKTIPFFNAIRSLGHVTTFILAHVTKDDTGRRRTMPFGSIYWWNLSRNIYELKGKQESDEDLRLILVHRKTNTFRRLKSPVGFRIESSSDTSMRFVQLDLKQDADLASYLPMRQRIYDALKDGAMTPSEIATAIGEDTSHTITTRLKEKRNELWQVIGKDGRENRWGLMAKGLQ